MDQGQGHRHHLRLAFIALWAGLGPYVRAALQPRQQRNDASSSADQPQQEQEEEEEERGEGRGGTVSAFAAGI